jgi:hypothetical protein
VTKTNEKFKGDENFDQTWKKFFARFIKSKIKSDILRGKLFRERKNFPQSSSTIFLFRAPLLSHNSGKQKPHNKFEGKVEDFFLFSLTLHFFHRSALNARILA